MLFRSSQYDMNHLVPIPSEEEWTDSLDAFFGGALGVWGSKWGACRIEVSDEGDYPLRIQFDSAWSPCDKLIQNISKQFPALLFGLSYTEESNAFVGWELYSDGKLVGSEFVSGDTIPLELQEIHDKLTSESSDEEWDEWYDLSNEWYNDQLESLDNDLETVTAEYIVWRRGKIGRAHV